MENANENANIVKQRHEFVSAWLVLMIIVNALCALMYLCVNSFVRDCFPENTSTLTVVLLGAFSIANVVFAVMLLKWKKFGFWGFTGTSILATVINLNLGFGVGQSSGGLVGVALLYGILQIKKDDVAAWKNLD